MSTPLVSDADRLRRLQALTDAALSSLDLDELLATMVERLREVLEVDTCAVLLLDAERQELVATAAVGIEEEVEQGVRIPLGKGFAGRVAAERRPVILDDVDHADVLNLILREKGIKSLSGVPLLVQDEVIGVLHVGSLVPRVFIRPDVELLTLVAGRVALAVERSRLLEETLALDELRLNFVAIASHELRTPATAVYGTLATLAQLKDLGAETRDELIRVGYEQAECLRRLTDQLLDLSRLDARNVALKPEKLAVREALAGILRDTVPADTTVELRVDPALTARIDPMVLDRVVSNLLINAIRHGSPPMLVSAERNDQGLLISVEDSGAGIQEELQPHVFERFTRAPDAVGPGLGLTIARTYAKAHGGDLVLAPTSSGARFELTVPQD
jgi:signal transduction histidine kinase